MLHFVISFGIAYFIVLFFDTIFKSCLFNPYISLMDRLGLSVRPYMAVWTITRFNSTFRKIGFMYSHAQRKWFSFGYYCSLVLVFYAYYVLITPVLRYFCAWFTTSDYVEPVVTVIPGITTPWSHMMYVIPAVLISMIFHELGHAFAASGHFVPVESCGISLVLIFPIAFVKLQMRAMKTLSYTSRLRVYSAGIWHNILLIALSLLVLSCFNFLPNLRKGSGITIMDIKKTSSLAHKGGFSVGDVVVAVNDCEVVDEYSWYHCLKQIHDSPQVGFCCSEKFIENHGNLSVCCTNSTDNMCFEHSENVAHQFLCLPARKFIENAKCCENSKQCPEELCIVPYLTSQEKLIKFKRDFLKPVLFIGSYEELIYSIEVTPWVSYTDFPSAVLISHLENFLKYLAGISAGLGIMNIIPCYYLDGGFILKNFLKLHFRKSWRKSTRKRLVRKLNIAGCFLLTMNIFIGVTNILDKNAQF